MVSCEILHNSIHLFYAKLDWYLRWDSFFFLAIYSKLDAGLVFMTKRFPNCKYEHQQKCKLSFGCNIVTLSFNTELLRKDHHHH